MEKDFDEVFSYLDNYIEVIDRKVASMDESPEKQVYRKNLKFMYSYLENYINMFKVLQIEDPTSCKQVLRKLKALNL